MRGRQTNYALSLTGFKQSGIGRIVLGNKGLKLSDEAFGNAVLSNHAVVLGLHNGAERINVNLVEVAALLLLQHLHGGGKVVIGELGQLGSALGE